LAPLQVRRWIRKGTCKQTPAPTLISTPYFYLLQHSTSEQVKWLSPWPPFLFPNARLSTTSLNSLVNPTPTTEDILGAAKYSKDAERARGTGKISESAIADALVYATAINCAAGCRGKAKEVVKDDVGALTKILETLRALETKFTNKVVHSSLFVSLFRSLFLPFLHPFSLPLSWLLPSSTRNTAAGC
ncbi:hypothetical protein B0H17DRAFT_1176533, partial [Mycena rosella]